LTAKFTVHGPVKIRTDFCIPTPVHKGEFIGAYDFVANPDAHAAEDATVHVALDKWGDVIRGKVRLLSFKRILDYAVFVDQILQLALTSGIAHRTIEWMGDQN
jgi:hypothetical protein